MTEAQLDRPDVTFEGLKDLPDRPDPADLRGEAMAKRDRSVHRRHHWLYEDLLN